MLAAKYLDNILKITKISDRLMCIKLVIAKEILNFFSGYAPQIGCTEQEKEAYWADFGNLLLSIPSGECRSKWTRRCNKLRFRGLPVREEILAKCKAHGLILTNTFFIKNSRHLITYSSGGHNTQIDYQLCRRTMKNRLKDCKVILGESLGKQHRLLVTEYFTRKRASVPAPEPVPKIKWHNLRNDSSLNFITTMKEYISDILALEQDEELTPQQMWTYLHEPCLIVAEEQLGVTRGYQLKRGRETWWWNERTRKAVDAKTKAFKQWGPDTAQKQALADIYKQCN